MNPNLVFSQDRLADFCRANGIASLAVFGSALRDDFGPDSDVDLLVEFQPEQTPGLHFVTIADELETFFGRPVDLLSRGPPSSRAITPSAAGTFSAPQS